MDTNLPPEVADHARRVVLQKKARHDLRAIFEGSTGKFENDTSLRSFKIHYNADKNLVHPEGDVWISNLVEQYNKILGVTEGVSYEEKKSSGEQSTATITLTGKAYDKMEALQTLVAQQQSGRTP